jgi:O-antigen/teichoic acid export membrane protein
MIRPAVSLGVIQVAGYVLPFATLAVAGRLVPPGPLSDFLYVQSCAALLAIVVDYGFHLSAVRAAGAAMASGTERRAYSAIHAAKAVLLLLALAAAAGLAATSGDIVFTPAMLAGLCLAVTAYGARPLWYFQVHERYRRLILVEIASGLVALVAVAAVATHAPDAGALAIAWALPRFLASLVLVCSIHSKHGFEWIKPREVLRTLRDSFGLFLHKASASAVHLGIPVLVAHLLARTDLLDFQRAERIFTAVQSLLLVVSQAGFARVVRLSADVNAARATALRASWLQLGLSTAVAIFVFMTSPFLVQIMWGVADEETVALLRVYACGFPLLALNAAIGLNVLLPQRRDAAVVGGALAGALTALSLVEPLVSSLGSLGAVAAVLAGELVILLVMLASLVLGRPRVAPN